MVKKKKEKVFCSIIEIEKEFYPETYKKRKEIITDQSNLEFYMAEKTLEKIKKRNAVGYKPIVTNFDELEFLKIRLSKSVSPDP